MWMLLFFGWSAAGAVSGFLVTELGFPYAWVTPFTLVMLGAMFFLAYRGYPVRAWLLAGCIAFILVAGMAIVRGLTVPEPAIPEEYLREFEAADQQVSWMGAELPYYEGYTAGDYYVEYDVGRESYLIAPGYERRTPVTIAFPPLDTAGGQWAFEAGSVRLRGGVSGTFEADPDQSWITAGEAQFEPDDTLLPAHPEMVVPLPLPGVPMREPLRVSARIDITYPLVDGEAGEVEAATLTRDFTMKILGSDYYAYYSQYTEWRRVHSVVATPIWAALVLGSVLAGAGGIYLVREGALQPEPASGLQIVVRRLSAAQQLGAEVHTLDKFRDLTSEQEGVFIGRVTAQSPAGRGGLRTGDILVELAGQPTNSPRVVNRIVKGRKKGERIPAAVLRAGDKVELQIRF